MHFRRSGLCGQDATRHLPKGPAQPPYLGCDLESYNDAICVGIAPIERADTSKRAEFIGTKGLVDVSFLSLLQ